MYNDLLLQKIKEKAKYSEFENRKFIQALKLTIALWTEENEIYSFAHRSLQEYFAALFLKNLNPIEKDRAYKKIVEKFSKQQRAFGVENFLLKTVPYCPHKSKNPLSS